MKWIIALGTVALIVALIIFQRNSVKTSFVNGLAPYNQLPNREYILEHDCYVFKLKNHNTDWPLIAANLTGTASGTLGLPDEISDRQIGADLPNIRILDVVRSGARFKIVSVRRDESRKGTQISFEILLLDEADRHYPRLDAFYIMNHEPEKTGAAPDMLSEYAVLRVKK